MAIATASLRNTLATSYGTAGTHAALFTADPGTTGSVTGEVTGGSYARRPITWSTASNGTITASVEFTGLPSPLTITHIGICGGLTGANLLDKFDVVDQTFSTANGKYTLSLSYTQS